MEIYCNIREILREIFLIDLGNIVVETKPYIYLDRDEETYRESDKEIILRFWV